MFSSYHEIHDTQVYGLDELEADPRYSEVLEFARFWDMGDVIVVPDGSYRYRVIGYLTDVSEDGSSSLVLLVAHPDLELPSYDEVTAIL